MHHHHQRLEASTTCCFDANDAWNWLQQLQQQQVEETRSTVAASALGSVEFAFAELSEVGRASGRRSRAGYESAAACATEAIESAGRSAATGTAAGSNDGTSTTSRERAGAGRQIAAARLGKTTQHHTHQMEATKVV